MPPGAVYVGRPSVWGNPWRAGDSVRTTYAARQEYGQWVRMATMTVEIAVAIYRQYAEKKAEEDPYWLKPLRGRDLVCWCSLDAPCHADALLELANRKRAA